MRSTAYGTNSSGKAITIILCLCIIAAAIWAATSDNAGGYISDKIFKPLFSKAETAAAQSLSPATPSPSLDSSTASTSGMVTVQLDYDAKVIYAIQIGAFSSYENAVSGAKDAIIYGGAGYIITKDGFHKLYTSAYLDEAEAQSQKTLLLSKGIDACMSTIEIDGVQLDITAKQAQIDVISASHSTWLDVSERLFALSADYEKGYVNTQEAQSTTKEIHADIQSCMAELSNSKDLSVVTEKLYENLSLCDEQLSSFLSSTLSDAEVSSSLKYLMIDFIYRFGQYANDISS